MGRKRRVQGAPGTEDAAYEAHGDPLLVALFEGDADGARCLIENNLCDIEAADQVGWRPLHRACYAGLDDIVSLLLERRADPTAVDADGVRPLHVAASKGHPDCCKLLVAAGADPTEPDWYTGMTPQIYAMSKEGEVGRQLGEVLGTIDLKLLAAWSNPAEMAKLVSDASTDEERASLEEKFIASLDQPAGCSRCDDSDPSIVRVVRTYNWGSRKGEESSGPEDSPASTGLWEAAMFTLPDLGKKLWVQEWDQPVLEYCSGVTKAHLDGDDPRKGFRLAFHFAENPYFTNSVLDKEYHTCVSSLSTGQVEPTQIQSAEIDWKPGRDVTVERAEGGGGEAGNREEEEGQPRFSFFRNFFCNFKRGGPLPDQFDEEGVRKMTGLADREQMLEMLMGVEHELGCSVRDQLVPFAERWCSVE